MASYQCDDVALAAINIKQRGYETAPNNADWLPSLVASGIVYNGIWRG